MPSDGHLDLRDRDRLYKALGEHVFDVAVIGAGITGAGIARDAAMRGLAVALVDAGDFAAGTSSRSSKLVHGGIRYLAQGDVALVREAARDRQIICRLAPHLAQRTLFLVPARTRWEQAKFKLALAAYERIGGIAADDRHETWDLKRLAREEPSLRQHDVVGALAYPEYITDDARLTLANVRSAAASGALAANYTAVTALDGPAAGISTLTVEDRSGLGERTTQIRARAIVNATGPWADTIRLLEDPAASAKLVLTKGIHLVLPQRRLPVRNTVNLKGADQRGMFAIPRGDVTYLGTTDTFFPAPAYWPKIEQQDIAYLLEAANRAFDIAPLGPDDVMHYWAGLRPLLADPGKAPSEISRRDEIMVGPRNMITISGGKLTAYRRMAARVTDRCEQALGRHPSPSRTADVPLPGGDLDTTVAAVVAQIADAVGDVRAADRLVRLYGTEATAIAADGGDVAAEVRQAVCMEGAVRLEDFWVRRSARAWFDVAHGSTALEQAADTMATLLRWRETERDRQLAEIRAREQAERAMLSGVPDSR